MHSRVTQLEGLSRADVEAHILAQAQRDPTFRTLLWQDPQAAWQQTFGETSLGSLTLRLLQDDEDTLHLVVPAANQDMIAQLEATPHALWRQQFGTHKLRGYLIRVVLEQPGELLLAMPHVNWAEGETLETLGAAGQKEQGRLSRIQVMGTLQAAKEQITQQIQQLGELFGMLKPDQDE